MVQGRKPNLHRLRKMERLRAKGRTLAQIVQQLGVSRQAVHDALKRKRLPRCPVYCCYCRARIADAGGTEGVSTLVCHGCLAARPGISFAQRLASLRFMSGMPQAAPARASAASQASISKLETGNHQPKPCTRDRLLAVLRSILAKRRNR
jgi:DNA-binding XRE family transcriptional regulator